MPNIRLFHEDGRIVGLSKLINRRKGRSARWEFKIRIRVPGKPKPRFTSISIDQHGFDQAFDMAIERICEWTDIDRFSETRKALLAAKARYLTDNTHKQIVHLPSNAEQPDLYCLEKGLMSEIEEFERNRNVINGTG